MPNDQKCVELPLCSQGMRGAPLSVNFFRLPKFDYINNIAISGNVSNGIEYKKKHKYVLVKYRNAEMSLSTVAIFNSIQILSIRKLINEEMIRI